MEEFPEAQLKKSRIWERGPILDDFGAVLEWTVLGAMFQLRCRQLVRTHAWTRYEPSCALPCVCVCVCARVVVVRRTLGDSGAHPVCSCARARVRMEVCMCACVSLRRSMGDGSSHPESAHVQDQKQSCGNKQLTTDVVTYVYIERGRERERERERERKREM
jgi:hypothetical protein